MPKFLPYGHQSIDQEDIQAVVSTLQSDWLTQGPAIEEFEKHLCQYTKAKHAISCSNGTTALHLALAAIGITSDHAVIVPSITFVATANAVEYVGGTVLFADVDPNTGLMTAETLVQTIQKYKDDYKIKALIHVHLAGQCENLSEIYKTAKNFDLFVIEDAAHAIGTNYIKDKDFSPIGSCQYSDLTTFSFHPVKTITTGEGGAVLTNDASVAERIYNLRSHGLIKNSKHWLQNELAFDDHQNPNPWYYEMHEVGFNYRLTDISCALGLQQLKKLNQFKKTRTELVATYDSSFQSATIQPMKKNAWSDTSWHLYVVHIDFTKIKKSRAVVMNSLKNKNIGTQVHYIPVHLQPYYKKKYGQQILPGAEKYYSSCLSIPLYVGLQNEEQLHVILALQSLT
jgi:UDP-4-amino-4,6-dideoxy-N-acetyl-beta-L-altrosamine transaminase